MSDCKTPPLMGVALLLYGVISAIISAEVHARGDYLDFWRDRYQNARASDVGCQVCHQSELGGDGWNFYGWTLRQTFGGATNVDADFFRQRIRFIERDLATDSDVETPGPTEFINEIDANAQPGWRLGNTNIVRFKNGSSTTAMQAPAEVCGRIDQGDGRAPCPGTEPYPDIELPAPPSDGGLCFPVITEQGRTAIICL